MSPQDNHYKIMSLLLSYGKVRRRNAHLQCQLDGLMKENEQLEEEIQRCKQQLASLRHQQTVHQDGRKSTHQRNSVLHSRHLLKLRSQQLEKSVHELDERLERLQLATFPIFP